MIVSKIYTTENDELTAVVLEDGKYSNFIYEPELVAFDSDGLIDEARYGFPSALPYEEDISEGNSVEDMAKLQEKESTLVAEIGDNIVIYPQRMSQYVQEIFEAEIGEELWNKILQDANGDEGIQVDF